MLIFLALGMGLGYFIYSRAPSQYSSEMIAQPNGFTSIDMKHYIDDIHDMCVNDNVEGLAKSFGISRESAKLISNIEAFYFIDVNLDGIGDEVDYKGNFDPADSTMEIIQGRILIRAEVYQNEVFNEVREGLKKYINDNQYLIDVNILRKMELESQINLTQNEIDKLDSLQNYEYYKSLDESRTNKEGQIVFLNENPTQLYYKDKELLLARNLKYQKALELATDPITIIKDFSALQTEVNPVLLYLLKYGFYFAFLGYLYLMFYAYRKRLIPYLSAKA
jgi:hypothetical protein